MGLPTLWPGHTLCALATPPAFHPPKTLAPVSCSISSSFTRRQTHLFLLQIPFAPTRHPPPSPPASASPSAIAALLVSLLAPGAAARLLESIARAPPSSRAYGVATSGHFLSSRHHHDAEPAAERSGVTSACDESRAFSHYPPLSLFFLPFWSPLISLPHLSPRPQCPPAWCDPLPSEPAAPVCAAARARPSACTRTAARPARTAQKACTNAICLRRAWPITTARAQLAIPQRIAQRATLCRRPGPVPLTPDSPLWAQAEPDTYRPPPKSECFCFLTRAHPLPLFFLLRHCVCLPPSSATSSTWALFLYFFY